jgi:hypothetical protein
VECARTGRRVWFAKGCRLTASTLRSLATAFRPTLTLRPNGPQTARSGFMSGAASVLSYCILALAPTERPHPVCDDAPDYHNYWLGINY